MFSAKACHLERQESPIGGSGLLSLNWGFFPSLE